MRKVAAAMVAAVALALVASGNGCSGDAPTTEKRLTIAFSNDMQGEVRSCGCASNDYGGLGRRATFLETVRDTTPDLLLVDGGGLFGPDLNYAREKADLTLKSLERMGYDALTLGEAEFGFGVDYIVQRTREIGLPVVVANLWDAKADTLLFPPTREIDMSNGVRVGIIGVMGERRVLPPQVQKGQLRLTSAAAAVRTHVAELRPKVDFVVVLAHVSRPEALRLAREIDGIDIIVHGSEGRVMRKAAPVNHTYILQVASLGRYMGVAQAVLGDDGHIRSLATAITPLSRLFRDDEGIAKLFTAYDLDIAAKEKTNVPAAVFATRQGIEKKFAGAESCTPCHREIDAQWRTTPHAHAFDRLTAESREYDRDCTPCHTTGFYERGGFAGFAVTPELVGIQCEACHGNGHDHVVDPKKKMPTDPRTVCRGCHTVDQSPEFDFEVFWGRIKHGNGG